MRTITINNSNFNKYHLLYSIVITCTQCSSCTVSKKINRNNKNIRFLKRGILAVFCQHHISSTSYHASTGWLQYHINLITWVPVEFQQKTNLALND